VFLFEFVLELYVWLKHVVSLLVDVELQLDLVEHAMKIKKKIILQNILLQKFKKLPQEVYEEHKYFHE
jgi:hypothetical protein